MTVVCWVNRLTGEKHTYSNVYRRISSLVNSQLEIHIKQ